MPINSLGNWLAATCGQSMADKRWPAANLNSVSHFIHCLIISNYQHILIRWQHVTRTSKSQRHIVEMYASATEVHLVSLWPWQLTSDLENVFSRWPLTWRLLVSSFTEIPPGHWVMKYPITQNTC